MKVRSQKGDTLLKLLRLLIDSMPQEVGDDDHYETNPQQREARELLRQLEKEQDENNADNH